MSDAGEYIVNWLTPGGGSNWLNTSVSSDRMTDIADKEETMVDALNALSVDPSTGLPALTRLKDEYDMALEKKERGVSSLSDKALTEKEKIYARLYKSGLKTHGKLAATERDVGTTFKRSLDETLSDFKLTSGEIEDRAIEQLTDIKDTIDATEDLIEDTTAEGRGPDFEYRTYKTTIDTKTKPLEVEEDMFKYDYLSGVKSDTRQV